MPKVSRKEAAQPLQAVARSAAMEEDNAAGASSAKVPQFAPLSAFEANGKRLEFRRVPVPQHRMTPLKTAWLALYKPVTETLKLDMRMNLKSKKVRGCNVWWVCMDDACGCLRRMFARASLRFSALHSRRPGARGGRGTT